MRRIGLAVVVAGRLTLERSFPRAREAVMKHVREAVICVLLVGMAACSVTTGVSFPNAQLGSGSTKQINGLLAKPEGNGPFPGVVLLHTCGGGQNPTGRVWAGAFEKKGAAT